MPKIAKHRPKTSSSLSKTAQDMLKIDVYPLYFWFFVSVVVSALARRESEWRALNVPSVSKETMAACEV